jgi:hypothetical protein
MACHLWTLFVLHCLSLCVFSSAELAARTTTTKINSFMASAIIDQYGSSGLMSKEGFHDFSAVLGSTVHATTENTDLALNISFINELVRTDVTKLSAEDGEVLYSQLGDCRHHGNWTACAEYLQMKVSYAYTCSTCARVDYKLICLNF